MGDPHLRSRTQEAYEALRAQFLGAATMAPFRSVGLTLLRQQGLAAWLKALSTCGLFSPAPTASSAPVVTADEAHSRGLDVIPSTQQAELALLLAGLVLSARPARLNGTACSGGCS